MSDRKSRFTELQKAKVRDRWRQIARDLTSLLDGGVLKWEMTVSEAVQILSKTEPPDE